MFTSLHIYHLRVFELITYLQRYIFIIFHLSRISEGGPYFFTLIICFSKFHLSQIPGKNHVILPEHYVFTYFICLRYLRRITLLCLNNIFFYIPFVSDIWKESCYFGLIICFSVFYLSRKLEKKLTILH